MQNSCKQTSVARGLTNPETASKRIHSRRKLGISLIVVTFIFTLTLTGCGGDDDPATTYTVTFNSNEGTAVTAISGIYSGDTITLPANPSKAGYDFVGWFTDNTTFVNAFTTSTQVTDNITVYAKWTAINTSIQKTVEDFYNFIAGITDLSRAYGKTFQEAFIEDTTDIAGIYLDSVETQAVTKTTTITAGLALYAQQSVWDELSPGGNNVIAELYRGTYAVDSSSKEHITVLTLGEYTLSGSGNSSNISAPNYRTKGGGDLIKDGVKVGTWAYVYSVRTKQGFIYQLTSGTPKTEIYIGASATLNTTVLSAYEVTIDLSDMASNPWGIYAVKN
jgi:uncharacterized repeat protein (TIGR02543 family)